MAAKPAPRPSDQELTTTFRRMRDDLQNIATKASELERDAEEHQLVLETLKQANEKDPNRKCFRMVGGILTERTVSDIVPVLDGNLQGIIAIVQSLGKQYEKKHADLREFQSKWNIQVVNR